MKYEAVPYIIIVLGILAVTILCMKTCHDTIDDASRCKDPFVNQ